MVAFLTETKQNEGEISLFLARTSILRTDGRLGQFLQHGVVHRLGAGWVDLLRFIGGSHLLPLELVIAGWLVGEQM